MSESTIYRFERKGSTYFPRLDTFVRLVEGMGLSLHEFIAGVPASLNDEQRATAVRASLDELRELTASLHALASAHLPTTPAAAPTLGTTRAVGTKSARGRRR